MHGGRLRESRHKRHSSAPSAPLPLTRTRHYNIARAVVMPRGRLTDALSHVAVDCDRSTTFSRCCSCCSKTLTPRGPREFVQHPLLSGRAP
jgi:hypothetical protein